MNDLEPKKLALLRILQIFEKYSDCGHHLTQLEIREILQRDYGITIKRDTISYNISLLKEAGIAIESVKDGSYLDERPLEDSELHMLIDGVLSSKYISAPHSEELISKLCGLSNKYFKSHVKNIYSVNEWSKTDNLALFLNIELIDEAIESGKRVAFHYIKLGIDRKPIKSVWHNVSPYMLVLHNQRYFLIGRNEWHKNMGFYRLDRIIDMEIREEHLTPLKENEGYENGFHYSDFANALPYMYTDKPEQVEFYADDKIVDQIIDWFGENAKMIQEDGRVKVRLKVSLQAMEFWAMQYLNNVEIVSPTILRDKIKNNIAEAAKKYN